MEKFVLTASVFIISLILTVVIERILIPYLKRRAKQPIYEGGPAWHLSKSGTPTMGGIAFLISISLCLLAVSLILIPTDRSKQAGISLIITLIFSVGNSLIGIFDDLMKLRRKQNAGLTPMQKITLQTLIAVIFLMARAHFLQDEPTVKLWFGRLDLGLIYYPLALIIILGIVNCANLTDGIDGLASSVSVAIGTVFLIIGYGISLEVPVLACAMVGGCLGFLFFNVSPAKIFMGDTGSLFLGALAVSLAFSMNNPIMIIFIGIAYVIEGISVILQVLVYKLTKKRLFKMAPLHHHLERCGISERRICIIGVSVTLLFSALWILVLGG